MGQAQIQAQIQAQVQAQVQAQHGQVQRVCAAVTAVPSEV